MNILNSFKLITSIFFLPTTYANLVNNLTYLHTCFECLTFKQLNTTISFSFFECTLDIKYRDVSKMREYFGDKFIFQV